MLHTGEACKSLGASNALLLAVLRIGFRCCYTGWLQLVRSWCYRGRLRELLGFCVGDIQSCEVLDLTAKSRHIVPLLNDLRDPALSCCREDDFVNDSVWNLCFYRRGRRGSALTGNIGFLLRLRRFEQSLNHQQVIPATLASLMAAVQVPVEQVLRHLHWPNVLDSQLFRVHLF